MSAFSFGKKKTLLKKKTTSQLGRLTHTCSKVQIKSKQGRGSWRKNCYILGWVTSWGVPVPRLLVWLPSLFKVAQLPHINLYLWQFYCSEFSTGLISVSSRVSHISHKRASCHVHPSIFNEPIKKARFRIVSRKRRIFLFPQCSHLGKRNREIHGTYL